MWKKNDCMTSLITCMLLYITLLKQDLSSTSLTTSFTLSQHESLNDYMLHLSNILYHIYQIFSMMFMNFLVQNYFFLKTSETSYRAGLTKISFNQIQIFCFPSLNILNLIVSTQMSFKLN